jgi:heptosyltransferase-2
MHLAAAIGVPVTAVFGPTNDLATRPLGDAHVVVTHPVWCRPCMLRECPLDHQCMRGVKPAAVVAAARRNL